jgi:hypothetical protein
MLYENTDEDNFLVLPNLEAITSCQSPYENKARMARNARSL